MCIRSCLKPVPRFAKASTCIYLPQVIIPNCNAKLVMCDRLFRQTIHVIVAKVHREPTEQKYVHTVPTVQTLAQKV